MRVSECVQVIERRSGRGKARTIDVRRNRCEIMLDEERERSLRGKEGDERRVCVCAYVCEYVCACVCLRYA